MRGVRSNALANIAKYYQSPRRASIQYRRGGNTVFVSFVTRLPEIGRWHHFVQP